MDIDLIIKNYRPFQDSHPAHIAIRKGFTAFIGTNNSGKSSLLRFFYEFRQLFQLLSNPTGNFVNAFQSKDGTMNFPSSVYDREELFNNVNDRNIQIEIILNAIETPELQPDKLIFTIYRKENAWSVEIFKKGQKVTNENGGPSVWEGSLLKIGNQITVDLSIVFASFLSLSNILYIGPFRNAVNEGTKDNYYDIQIGQSFIQSWDNYKTGNNKRQSEATYRLTQDIKHIFEFSDFQINPSSDKRTLQLFINGKPYMLSEQGSGLAQFILVLANAAIRQPSFILIDEPELNLHPSLQLDFLTTLGTYASDGVIFATHSIGLARSAAERIYSIRRDPSQVRSVTDLESVPSLSEFLGELSFSGYRDLGFDKILLVEGPTELKTVQQFLRKFKKDHQVVLLPLGGGSLIKENAESELEEIKRISDNVFALIDSEKESSNAELSKERKAFVQTCKKLKINCHVLEKRAIENYMIDRAIKVTMKSDKHKQLEPYESIKTTQFGWAKSESWKIAKEMTKEEIEGTDLGKFIQAI